MSHYSPVWVFSVKSVFSGFVKGVGALVAAIGLGQIIGLSNPNTSEELNAVEDFENRFLGKAH